METAVAAAGSGQFVVVWESYWDQDGFEHGVFGQRFDSAGDPLGTEFLIPTTTTGSERRPSVAMTDNGDFVVVWESWYFVTGYRSILGQRFDASGVPSGTEFVVAGCGVPCFDYASYPDVDHRGNDRFVVVWQHLDGSPSITEWDVFGQRYDAAGLPDGGPFLVNSYTTDYQLRPAIDANDNGSFVVVWQGYPTGKNPYSMYNHVFVRRFDVNGVPTDPDFQVNSVYYPYPEFQRRPAVGINQDGSFVVAWEVSGGVDGYEHAVFARRFDSADNPLGAEWQVNTYTTDNQWYSTSVDTDDYGSFLVVWASGSDFGPGQDGAAYGMFGQRYCSDFNNNSSCDRCGEVLPPMPIDHFLCYTTHGKQIVPVVLSDKFEDGAYDIRREKRLCIPADKEDEGILDGETHLTRYRAKGNTDQKEPLVVTDQFGTFRFAPKRTKWLMVPTAVSPVGFPPPGLPNPGAQVDHYRCVKVRELPSTTSIGPISVVDTFASRTLFSLTARELCIATDKNGEGMKNPEAHLLCYKGKTTAQAPHSAMQTHDQFGVTPDRKIGREREFCVPSTVSSR